MSTSSSESESESATAARCLSRFFLAWFFGRSGADRLAATAELEDADAPLAEDAAVSDAFFLKKWRSPFGIFFQVAGKIGSKFNSVPIETELF